MAVEDVIVPTVGLIKKLAIVELRFGTGVTALATAGMI
jgi:hypothetical protein